MKRYKIINKTRFFITVIFTLFISFLVLSLFRTFGNAENIASNAGYEEVYISQGDTVWNISLRYKPDKLDVRDMVAEIREFNNLDDLSIKPGDVIMIPNRKR